MPNNFSYTTGIPAINDNPSTDQPIMLQNTNSISSIISVDHIGFNANGSGIHKQVTLQNSATPPGLGDGVGVAYSNNASGTDQPYWQNGPLNPDDISQFFVFSTKTPPVASTNGYTYLPGGLIIQWGRILNAVSQTFTPVTFVGLGTIAFPNNCFNVQTTINEGSSANSIVLNVASLSSTGFAYYNTSSNVRNFYWVAIGN